MALKVIITLVALFIVFLILASLKLFRSFFVNERIKKDYSKTPEAIRERTNAYLIGKNKFLNLPYEEIHIKSDKYNLVGYYLSYNRKKTAILLHGWKGNAEERMADAFKYIESGYNVFLPDLRGHGKSDGKYIGMGCAERKDIFRWIDYLREKYGDDKDFILDGISMGGATVLALSGDVEATRYIKAIISDCAFSSVQDLIPNFIDKIPKIFSNFLTKMVEMWCTLLCGFSFYNCSPISQIKKSKTPILIIHGTEDRFVPFEMGKKLYNACSSEKEYWAVEGAKHIMSSWVAKDKYSQKVKAFLDKYI